MDSPSSGSSLESDSITHSPSGPYTSAPEKYAHDYFLHWMQHYTSPRAVTDQVVWTDLIPQIAFQYAPLRDAMIACGHVGTSLIRRDPAHDYAKALRVSTESANRAIGGLVGPNTSSLLLMIAAWMFWQLDMTRGYIASSAVHIQSAFRIASGLPDGKSKEEQIIKQLILESNISMDFTMQLESNFPTMLAPQEFADARRIKAVVFLQHSLRQVLVASMKFSDEELSKPGGARLWTILERSKRELRWILRKWAAHRSVSTGRGAKAQEEAMRFSRKTITSIFSPYLESIGTDRFTEAQLEMEFARVLPVFLLRVSQDDLELRQDLAEFMEVVSKDREESRPICGVSTSE